MASIFELSPHIVHVGALLHLVAYAFRNQIVLRSFAIAGSFAYSLHYLVGASEPLWSPMSWSGMSILINIVLIVIIIGDNRQGNLSDDELKLFRMLPSLSPGDFRKLARLGMWRRAASDMVLTAEGKSLDRLFFVPDDAISIDKAGRRIRPESGMFAGEIAFLLGRPATASVQVAESSH